MTMLLRDLALLGFILGSGLSWPIFGLASVYVKIFPPQEPMGWSLDSLAYWFKTQVIIGWVLALVVYPLICIMVPTIASLVFWSYIAISVLSLMSLFFFVGSNNIL